MIVSLPPALRIVTIADRGNSVNERIHFEVIRDCDLASYVVMATLEVSPGRIAAGFRPVYWFVSDQVKAGDHLILYTREGQDGKDIRADGHRNHFFFWGVKGGTMFPTNAKVVLVEINQWVTGG